MTVTIMGNITSINQIHLLHGSAVEIHVKTFNGDDEHLMVAETVFRSAFALKINNFQSLVGRRIAFKLEYVQGEYLKLVESYLI